MRASTIRPTISDSITCERYGRQGDRPGSGRRTRRQAHHRYVTVSFKEVEFHKPVYVGDVLSLYAETQRAGRTSITIKVRVCANRRLQPEETVEVTQAEVVFVAVGADSKPVPIFGD